MAISGDTHLAVDKYPYFWLSGPSGFKHTDKQAS